MVYFSCWKSCTDSRWKLEWWGSFLQEEDQVVQLQFSLELVLVVMMIYGWVMLAQKKRCFLHVIEYNPGDYVSVYKCEILCDLLNFSQNIFFIIIIISSLNLLSYGVWIDASYPNFFSLPCSLQGDPYKYNMLPPLPAQRNLTPPPTLYPQQPVAVSENYSIPRFVYSSYPEISSAARSKRSDINV